MRLSVLMLTAVLLCGCSNKPWYQGQWTVNGFSFGAVSALSEDEAKSWLGKTVMYATTTATFEEAVCEHASYNITELTAQTFSQEYRTTLSALGIKDDTVKMLQVNCADGMVFPGSTLLQVNDTTAYLPWDGVFFKLEKTSSNSN